MDENIVDEKEDVIFGELDRLKGTLGYVLTNLKQLPIDKIKDAEALLVELGEREKTQTELRAVNAITDLLRSLKILKESALNMSEVSQGLLSIIDQMNTEMENMKPGVAVALVYIGVLEEFAKEERAKSNYYKETLEDNRISHIPWGASFAESERMNIEEQWANYREKAPDEVTTELEKKMKKALKEQN